MESATNSWGKTNMMALSERALDVGRNTAGERRVQKLRDALAEKDGHKSASTQAESAETVHSIKEELIAVRREHAKLQQAIYEAAQVQRKLCAPRELVSGEFEIAGEIFPVRHLSGDFFKVMQLAARKHSAPADAVADVNRELCQDQDERPLMALFFARLDPQCNDLIYCNAGLPAPLLLQKNKTVDRLEAGGPMLGAMPQAAFQSGKVLLNPGDMLIAYSDGVTECRNSQDEEFEI